MKNEKVSPRYSEAHFFILNFSFFILHFSLSIHYLVGRGFKTFIKKVDKNS